MLFVCFLTETVLAYCWNKQTGTNKIDCQSDVVPDNALQCAAVQLTDYALQPEAAVRHALTAKLWRRPTWKSADFFRTLAPILALSQLSCSTVFFRRWRAASAWATASWTVGTCPPAGATAAKHNRVYCVTHQDLQPVKRQLICIEQQCTVAEHGVGLLYS